MQRLYLGHLISS